MKTKWLKNGYIWIFVALLMAVPFFRLSANSFESVSVIDLINKDRAERNISPLVSNEKLSKAAREKAYDMISHNYFAHVSPSGVTPWQWIEDNGYDYSFAGENLAINFTNPETQHQALMNSESHKKNILNEKYEEIGVAVVSGIMNGKQTIITVQEFGTQMKNVPASKAIAGFAVTKATANGINSGKKSWKNEYLSMDSVQKIPTAISEKMSVIPFMAFVYVSIVLIAIVFFSYEVMHGHIHIRFHHFSLREKKISIPVEIIKSKNLLQSTVEEENLNLEKIYITHMKMRN